VGYGEPSISIVVTTRNDDHGGSLLRRTQTFINALIGQCKRHDLPAELLIVEWNPPVDRPRLAQALRWPADPSPCQVRIIEVPPALHARLKISEVLPLFQMIGKNVGIRRARAPFILCTNIDILFSDELMQFLASGELRAGRMYRIDRHDVETDVPVDAPVEAQVRYCREHLLRLNAPDGTFVLSPEGRRMPAARDILSADLGVSLGAGWYAAEEWAGEVVRWIDHDAELHVQMPPGPTQALSLSLEPWPGVGCEPFELCMVDDAGQTVARGVIGSRQEVSIVLPLPPGTGGHFRLHAVGGGRPLINEPRNLICRVFGIRWTPLADLAQAPELPGAINLRAIDVGACLPEDIAAVEAGVQFGSHWRARVVRDGRRVRGVADDARLIVTAPPGPPQALSLEIEPGPGVNYQPFELQVCDRAGQLLARGRVQERERVSLLLPLEPGQSEVVFLRVAEDDRRVTEPTNPFGIENFFVWHCAWAPAWTKPSLDPPASGAFNFTSQEIGILAAPDIVPADLGVSFGRGWYGVEREVGETFRWAGDHARLFVTAPTGPRQALSLEVKPGVGVRDDSFGLEVRDSAGRCVARGRVKGRQVVSLRLPLIPGQTERFTLHVEGGGQPDWEGRVLNFRLFRCVWTPDWQEPPNPAAAEASNFKAVGVREPCNLPARLLRRCRNAARSVGWTSAWQQFQAGRSRLARSASAPRLTTFPVAPGASDAAEPDAIAPVFLHLNACGDFTLMAREHWFALRGYPELEIFSLHLDSVFCYMAHHGGAREERLPEPMRIYHIEHGIGSGWTPEGATRLMERVTAKGIPVLTFEEVCTWATRMRQHDRPLQFNGDNWGLADEVLPETPIPRPDNGQIRMARVWVSDRHAGSSVVQSTRSSECSPITNRD
jgi:hypothetical protein